MTLNTDDSRMTASEARRLGAAVLMVVGKPHWESPGYLPPSPGHFTARRLLSRFATRLAWVVAPPERKWIYLAHVAMSQVQMGSVILAAATSRRALTAFSTVEVDAWDCVDILPAVSFQQWSEVHRLIPSHLAPIERRLAELFGLQRARTLGAWSNAVIELAHEFVALDEALKSSPTPAERRVLLEEFVRSGPQGRSELLQRANIVE